MSFATTIKFDPSDLATATADFRDAMKHHRVVRLVPTAPIPGGNDEGNLRSFYDTFLETAGTPVNAGEAYDQDGAPDGERWSQIRYDADVPDDVAFRHSKNAQPLHTDESYVSDTTGVMFFFCINRAPSGGETIFIDGPDLVATLETNRPDLLERLTSMDVTYEKAGDSRTQPIISLRGDAPPLLNFNYYCADPSQPADSLALNEEFFQFIQNDLDPARVLALPLNPGEALAWDDRHLLHGRNSFTAHQTNDRHILKAGLILEGVNS